MRKLLALKLLTHSLTYSLTHSLTHSLTLTSYNIFSSPRFYSLPLIFLSLFFSLSAFTLLTGCSGTSDTTSVTTSTTSSLSGKVRLSGTLAVGAPIPSAAITIRDSKGNAATATSGADGTYTADVEDKPPYVLRVPHPNVSDKYIYSYAAKGGVTANIHPLTDPIMRAWFRAQSQDIDDAFSGYGSSSAVPIPTESEINIIKAVVKEVIKDLLRAVKDDFGTGITVDNFDPITTTFNADSKGFDKVLDGTKINMSGGTVSIAVTPDSTLETDVRTTGGNTTATLDTTNISLTADTTPPTAPTNLSALSVSSSQILLTWSASSSTDVLGYKVYQSGTEVATVTSTVYIVPGLSASTSYTFTVKAFDGATNLSDASTSASATTSAAATDTTAPTAPTNLTATVVSSTQIDLSWTASTDAVGVAGYIVYRDGTAIAKVFTTNYSDIGLTADKSYAYTVKAFDGAGNKSDASTSATGSTSTTTTDTIAPTAPTNLTATAVSRSEINLSWTASTDAVGVSGYYIYRGTTKIGTVTSTTYSDTGLSASTKYCYTVKAYDAANNVSNTSTEACATTEAKPTNPLVGTWGQTNIAHLNNGTWDSNTCLFTYNSNNTGMLICKDYYYEESDTFTYSVVSNTDGSFTLSMTFSDGTQGTNRWVIGDDGGTMILDGTSKSDRQRFRVAVRLDTTKTYSNADLSGDYYGIGYNIYSGGIYVASQILTFDGNGNYSLSETGNENGTISTYTGSGTYSVNTDGSNTFTPGPAGYLSGDGKLGVHGWVADATKFGAGVGMKKGDKTYSTSDLAGTWAFAGFDDYQGTNFSAMFGTTTCDSTGSCTFSIQSRSSDGTVAHGKITKTISTASDGSISLPADNDGASWGAIGNNGNTMILGGNFNGINPNYRTMVVAVRCSTCSDLATKTVSDYAGTYSGTWSDSNGSGTWSITIDSNGTITSSNVTGTTATISSGQVSSSGTLTINATDGGTSSTLSGTIDASTGILSATCTSGCPSGSGTWTATRS